MNVVVYAIAFCAGALYGRWVERAKAAPLLLLGILSAVLLGNYPYYSVEGFSTVFISSLIGVVVGGRIRR
ncbi:MAG: hypothetical protein GF416_02045 [Candidatus Altiarchaeales archaeon]|nr:hypothetical protein [Candidatus Altiarchaeales archaeon]MBD3415899.1 hypothetical protein [Candidatus Altiarchaeales archaeon]